MKCIHCKFKGQLATDEQGDYCPRCGMAQATLDSQPSLPDLTTLIEEAKLEADEDPRPPAPSPPPSRPVEEEEQEEVPDDWVTFEEKKPMVKRVAKKAAKKPAKKSTAAKDNGAAKGSAKKGAAKKAKRATSRDYLSRIDEILMRELAHQKKGEYKKMKTEDQLNAELDKLAKAEGKEPHANGMLHQGVRSYRTYFNSESKSQGGKRLPSDPFLFSRERILKMVEKGDNVKAKIAEYTKQKKASRKS